MTDPVPAASALANISPWAWGLYVIAGILATGLLGYVLWSLGGFLADTVRIAVQLARYTMRRRRLVTAISAVDGAQRVTRAMSLAELDAIHGPTLGELTGPDHVVTGQLAAAQDALTPRMVAPTRADLASARQSCHRCRTGSTAFRCTCPGDCFEVHCHGGTA